MSAQIPETMLLSDLLKPTGYDCPEDFIGKTFAEATAGGDVQTNKAATIDVSAYTEPIVIKPDTDYESMQKTTVTLSNIPSPHGTLYAWKNESNIVYTKVAAPTTSDKALVGAATGLSEAVIASVGEGSITIGETTYEAYATGNVEV